MKEKGVRESEREGGVREKSWFFRRLGTNGKHFETDVLKTSDLFPQSRMNYSSGSGSSNSLVMMRFIERRTKEISASLKDLLERKVLSKGAA